VLILLKAAGDHLPSARKLSRAQLKAGNYAKPRLLYQGLPISIENPRGSVRRGIGRGGKAWATSMQHDYGYVRGTVGADGDHFDVYVGPNAAAPVVYVVDTMAPPAFTRHDEQKAMLGFNSEDEARAAYLAHYDNPAFMGAIHAMPIEDFKRQVLATIRHGGELKDSRA
jgi:inorganic pyrophosphatase